MYKEIFADFELSDSKLIEELKAEYKRVMDPETLARVEHARKFISDNKKHFDYLKEISEQLRSELAIFFPKEMSNPGEFTEDQFEEEYESFQGTENYSKLSEKIDTLTPGLNKVEQAFLIQTTFVLSVCLKLNLNSDKVFKILEILIYFFISKQNLNDLIANTFLYSDVISILSSSMSKNQEISQK
ncbi:MAG: hypothetical protein ACRCYA_03025 [Cetobacterium sp.]|uniref:hypothetical protein n=1 Tax=Cetobacterium sp. TaxID=2071632 RepID=UPI003F2FC1ED